MKNKIIEIMAKVFDVSPDSINEDSSIDNVDAWDSLRHMYLVMALEEEFGVEFSHEQIPQMLNFKLVLLSLRELLPSQSL